MTDTLGPCPLNDAASLRRRYALTDKQGQRLKAKIQLEDLCVHPQNRGGTYPSALRVVGLLCSILQDRFLKEEASHEAVVVQALPPSKHADYQRAWGKPYKTHADHNVENTGSVDALRLAFTNLATYSYGALSHCTLLLGLMCIKHGAAWELPAEYRGCGLEEFQTGPGGSWDIQKMRRDDRFSELIDVLDNGLPCEVLAWGVHLDSEFRDGPGLIAAALNDPQGKGLTFHEMELLSSVAEHVSTAVAEGKNAAPDSNTGQPRTIPYEVVKASCANRHPTLAKATWFDDMFNFVINIGGASEQFIPQILDYDRRWVDHSKRTLSPAAWGILNQVPTDCPHVKVALVMRAYSQEPKGGICAAPEPTWARADAYRMQDLSALLRYVRRALAPAAAEATSEEQGAISIARTILAATEAFFQAHVKCPNKSLESKTLDAVCEAVRPHYHELVGAWEKLDKNAGKELDPPPAPWTKLQQRQENPVVPGSSGGQGGLPPQPVLIEFNQEGKPINSQMSSLPNAMDRCMLTVPVKPWLASATCATLDTDRWHQASIASVMTSLHRDCRAHDEPVQMQYDVHAKSVHVVATGDVAEGKLSLFPCCPTAKHFPKVTSNPRAVELHVGEKRPHPVAEMEKYWALPDFKLPEVAVKPMPATSAQGSTAAPEAAEVEGTTPAAAGATGAAAAAAGGGDAGAEEADNPYNFKFAGSESLHFFWGVERMTAEELARAQLVKGQERWKFNVALREQEFAVMTKCSPAVPMRVCTVVAPLMFNTAPLERGDRLILEIKKEKKKAPDSKHEKPAWQKANQEQERKRKKDADEGRKASKSCKPRFV